ncbi:hypothetical protein NM688_g6346 [Phlebia brevispora]|uniref:Uncharacterized protein n=1 Tax=Phlebia brevispora TaxID=194682 RepID=A0ACC1SH38_9APHY|nr:hypothetical protein NM688_g6346 [Phlebia brevispora]
MHSSGNAHHVLVGGYKGAVTLSLSDPTTRLIILSPILKSKPLTMSLKTHLDVLRDSASQYSSRAVFKLPVLSPGSDDVQSWAPIIYPQFQSDVERYARYWGRVLSDDGVSRRSVVGLWLAGLNYQDVLHIYGLARAGFIPQLFSLRLPNPDVIYELLRRADASALIYDSSFRNVVTDCPLPRHSAEEVSESDVEGVELAPLSEAALKPEDIVMIFHTSGSTSGSPKLVPCSLRWLDSIIAKAEKVSRPKDPQRQDVTVWMGSMCHIGQTFMLLGALQHGSCTIQPTTIGFSSDELADMIRRCNLNRLNAFASFLANHIRRARQDPKLLGLLTGLDEVLYSGLPLGRDEEEFAIRSGIPLRNLFGNTECGAMLLSIGGDGEDSRLLQPIEGTSYDFTPVTPSSAVSATSSSSDTAHKNANASLLELVIRSDSGDCPDESLRQPDGHYHTGDLFLEVKPGSYVSRGRDDDWIKSENSLRCDTKAIEDNVRTVCGEWIDECIVVGNGRPSPVLFVEPKDGSVNPDRLKRDVIRRTRPFHARRYLHERITSPNFIVVVPKGTLPRTATKGNIRRRAVEETFKETLDRIYGVTTS